MNSFKKAGAFLSFVALLATAPIAAGAVPAQIIILRHGEKQNDFALCDVGVQRSLALEKYYLGKQSANSLFPHGQSPAAFFVITLHTLELATPASTSWHAPLIDYSVVPLPITSAETTAQLNERTREAAENVLHDSRWDGKIVVVVWEHKHIANQKLEKQFPGPVTLRQLLHLDALGDQVPDTWSGDNYDYFWIVDYGNPHSTTPTKIRIMKQQFAEAFGKVPQNDWNTPETLPSDSDCKQ